MQHTLQWRQLQTCVVLHLLFTMLLCVFYVTLVISFVVPQAVVSSAETKLSTLAAKTEEFGAESKKLQVHFVKNYQISHFFAVFRWFPAAAITLFDM